MDDLGVINTNSTFQEVLFFLSLINGYCCPPLQYIIHLIPFVYLNEKYYTLYYQTKGGAKV